MQQEILNKILEINIKKTCDTKLRIFDILFDLNKALEYYHKDLQQNFCQKIFLKIVS